MTAIPLGRASLRGSVLPTRRLVRSHTSTRPGKPCRHVGLFGIAARRDCPFHPPAETVRRRLRTAASRLVSVALILTSRWTAVSCYAALCSPDLPPVHPFGLGTSGGLARFTGRLSATGCRVHPPPVLAEWWFPSHARRRSMAAARDGIVLIRLNCPPVSTLARSIDAVNRSPSWRVFMTSLAPAVCFESVDFLNCPVPLS